MSQKYWLTVFLVAGIIAGPAVAQSLVPIDPATVSDGHVYLMDNVSADLPDVSANNNNGNLIGSPQTVPGLNGEALQFNGTSDGVHLPDATTINTSTHQNKTVIAVFNCADVTKTSKQIVYEEGGSTRGLTIYVHEGLAYAGAWNRGDYSPDFLGTWLSAPIGSNEWHVVAGVLRDAGAGLEDDKFEMWMDGVLVAKGPGGELRARSDDNAIANVQAQTRVHNEEVLNAGNWFEGIVDEVWILNQALSEAELAAIGFAKTSAQNPVPADGAVDVIRDGMLSWDAGQFAQTHDVYFGSAFDDVNNASRGNSMGLLASQGQSPTSYDPGRLEFGQTYYWRVDEVNAAPDNTIYKGDVWSFEVEPFAYPIANITVMASSSNPGVGPENTIDGSGLDAEDLHSIDAPDMWLSDLNGDQPTTITYTFDHVYKLHEMLVWNYNVQFEAFLGYGLKDVTVEYSENGVDWMALGDYEFAQGTSAPGYAANTTVDFGGVPVQAVRLTANSNWGGMVAQYGLSEVRFMYIPTFAREPQPADGATGLDPATTLSWRAGREAGTHEIYLGTDPNDLTMVDAVNQASYAPDLAFGNTYYWQVVEVNETEAVSAWAGGVWSLSTLEYALIDGFEEYNDDVDAGTTIFDTWIDGWVNNNGSTVGYFDAPFAERTIVRSGSQSMPLAYDNTASPFYSEAERVFDSAQNWSVNGADTLVVYFQGVPGAFAELPSGKIILGAAGADIWNAADEFRFAYKPLNGNGSIIAYVESVANTNAWAKGGVMIRETLDAGSTFAAVYSTPGNGCRYQARLTTDVAAVSDTSVATAEQIALLAPHWVKIERVGNDFNGYYSTDGENWTSMSWNPQTIAMTPNVYIGLALTSHAAGVLASAEFSQVATTGNVTGQWSVETIGPAQPDGNGHGSLYVTLEDATRSSATVSHPSGDAAVLLGGWNEWAIPFSEFTGVNLGRIEVMKIGVGNPTSPTAGGTGIIYVDDIGYGHPAN